MITIDASIVVKWFLAEEVHSSAALNVFSLGRKLVAPAIIRFEVTAAIAKAARLDRIPSTEARHMIDQWVAMLDRHVVSLIDTESPFKQAVSLCLDLRHPFHDCMYLAVARLLKTPLATTDKRLIEQAHKCSIKVHSLMEDEEKK